MCAAIEHAGAEQAMDKGMKEGEVSNALGACPDCNTSRDLSKVCPRCGAPPVNEHRKTETEGEVRTTDLEPYVTLRYIARLFKVLGLLMVVMMIAEVVIGIMSGGAAESITSLVAGATRMLVLAGLMWGAGDLAILLIDAGHDLRVARILLGRINAELHRAGGEEPGRPTEIRDAK